MSRCPSCNSEHFTLDTKDVGEGVLNECSECGEWSLYVEETDEQIEWPLSQ